MTASSSTELAQRIVLCVSLTLALSAAAQESGRPPQPVVSPAPPVLILPAEPGPAAPTPAAPTAAPPASPPQPVVITKTDAPIATVHLKDGQTLRGRVVSREPSGLVLDLGGGVRVTVPKEQIDVVLEDRPGARPEWRPDSNRTRYLYSPSGFMLRSGEVYFSQTELLYSSINFGVTNFLTLGIGSAIPFLFVKDGANFVAVAKVGGSLGDYVHLAGGAQTIVLPGVGSGGALGFLFGTVTVGTPDAHLGVSVGPPFATSRSQADLGPVLVSVSGNLRVANSLALVTENWFAPSLSVSNHEASMINAFALRIIGDHIGVDLGLMHVPDATVPIPWLDFTYNFH